MDNLLHSCSKLQVESLTLTPKLPFFSHIWTADIFPSGIIDKIFPPDKICFNFTSPEGISSQNLTDLTDQEKLKCEQYQLCRSQLDRGFAPLEFTFLLFYIILIGIQLFSMILHRIQTLVHWLGHNDARDDLLKTVRRHTQFYNKSPTKSATSRTTATTRTTATSRITAITRTTTSSRPSRYTVSSRRIS